MTGGGVTFLDHTADVGMDVTAPTPELLFHRAALGMLALLRGQEDEQAPDAGRAAGAADVAALALEAEDVGALLADWLRELLFLHGTRHTDYRSATFERLSDGSLAARVETEPARPAAREIKGVTYHELGVEQTEDGWTARVIFDV